MSGGINGFQRMTRDVWQCQGRSVEVRGCQWRSAGVKGGHGMSGQVRASPECQGMSGEVMQGRQRSRRSMMICVHTAVR